jgi:LacI family gluconate utilization system Gnt-I transcriptional repressor
VNTKPTKRAQTTLKDIAEAANVSEMTVSRVLRNTGSMSQKTRQKVLDVVDELGFVPNKIAGSLATSSSNLIAVIVPSLINQVFTEVLAGITDQLESQDFKSVIGISEYDPKLEEGLIRSMLSWRPSGLIVSGMKHTDQTLKMLENAGIPIVQIMSVSENPVDACVGVDHIEAGALMAQHFIERGFKRIGYIGWSDRDLNAAKRFEGFSLELAKHNITVEGTVEFDQPLDMELGKVGLKRLLAEHPDLEAVYFPNDVSAIGGYFYCIESGIDVPKDLAIAGFSGLSIGQLLPTPLTTIGIDRFEIGQRSAEIITQRLNNETPELINVRDIKLIKGSTT